MSTKPPPTARHARRDKRSRLVDTAARLVHAQGFDRTTLADIARESGVPLGNVYYYFKTKEAIGEALVDQLAGTYTSLREVWDAMPGPRARLDAFIQITMANRDSLSRSGCPVGTLCAELHKADGPLAQRAAAVFSELLSWIESQFRLLGQGRDSRDLAVHLLSALQGASLLTHTFHDPRYVVREAKRLQAWVDSLSGVGRPSPRA
jgi:TetR/AcrR family transcriptional repressor of nem operon